MNVVAVLVLGIWGGWMLGQFAAYKVRPHLISADHPRIRKWAPGADARAEITIVKGGTHSRTGTASRGLCPIRGQIRRPTSPTRSTAAGSLDPAGRRAAGPELVPGAARGGARLAPMPDIATLPVRPFQVHRPCP